MSGTSAHSQANMQQAAGKVSDAAGKIKQIQGQLHGHQAELGAAWKGQSASAFTRVFQMFDTEFGNVLKDLNIIHEKLVDTRIKYQAAEQQKEQRVNQVSGLING